MYVPFMGSCWYVAYGSNAAPARLREYLAGMPGTSSESDMLDASRVVDIPHALYFAGTSSTWGGGVAFVSLLETDARTKARAYKLETSALDRLAERENGWDGGGVDWRRARSLRVGEWLPLPVIGTRPTQGKYNALLRVADIDGEMAFTFTTGRRFDGRAPAPQYLQAIASGGLVTEDGLAGASFEGSNAAQVDVPPGGPLGIDVTGEIRVVHSFPAVVLPRSYGKMLDGCRTAFAAIGANGKSVPGWVVIDDRATDVCVTLPLADRLGRPDAVGQSVSVAIEVAYGAHLDVLPGTIGDIPATDVVHVAARGDRVRPYWGILSSASISTPVRVEPRAHVPVGALRIPYALRVFMQLQRGQQPYLQRIPRLDGSPWSRLRRLVSRSFVRVFGAPVAAVRYVEGLVGDDGQHVVRVDPGVLSTIRVRSGEKAVVTWAGRSLTVVALEQSDLTRRQMEEQLAETTGLQTRRTFGDPVARLRTPAHLRAWVSAKARHELGIPPDGILRIRRSVFHVVPLRAAAATLPVAGLIIAFSDFASVDWRLWVAFAAAGIGLGILALRK